MKDVLIPDQGIRLPGLLNLPEKATGIIIFAHGSGSSRLSSRNQQVARALNELGLATLLFDLLTEEEAIDRTNVFDLSLLSSLAKGHGVGTKSARIEGVARRLFWSEHRRGSSTVGGRRSSVSD